MNPDEFDRDAWQELRQAIRNDDLGLVGRLVSQHPEYLSAASWRDSCIYFAAGQGRLRILRMLVEMGADINEETSLGETPLEAAASDGHLEVVTYLVERGATLEAQRPERNPLFAAIYGGHLDVAHHLLAVGMDPHITYRGESGRLKNALSFAQEYGRSEIVELLQKAGCRVPVEGVDQPVWEPEKAGESAPADSAAEEIIARMAEQYGPVDPLALQEIVPVHDEVHIAVHVIPPNDRHPYLTLFSTGMSDRPMKVPEGEEEYQYAELVMHLPATWPHPHESGAGAGSFWPFEWLRKVAYFPHLNGTWLGGQTTIISSDDPPVPLGPNTRQSCLLLLADFNDWSPMVLDGGKCVHFYTVVPLYTEERDFEKQHGIPALLHRLQQRGYNAVVDVDRENAAR